MRGFVVAALACSLLLTGCVRMAQDSIDQARGPDNLTSEAPQESTAGNDTPTSAPEATTPEATTPQATPTPSSPTPTPPPATSTPPPPAPTPTPPPPSSTPPPPAPTPTPSPPTPTPSPTPAPQAWPHEGSYVKYRIDSGGSAPDGSWSERTQATASWTYHNGDWTGSCEGTHAEYWAFNDSWTNSTRHASYTAAHPPHWPPFDTKTPPAVGQPVVGWGLSGCAIEKKDYDLDFTGSESEPVIRNGQAALVATYKAESPADSVPRSFVTEWMRESGLVAYWHWQYHYAHDFGDLIDTDAPG